jgi:hypothetical protein
VLSTSHSAYSGEDTPGASDRHRSHHSIAFTRPIVRSPPAATAGCPRARLDSGRSVFTLRLGDKIARRGSRARGEEVRDDNGESALGGAVLAAQGNGDGEPVSPGEHASGDGRRAAGRRAVPRRDPLARASRDRHLVGDGRSRLSGPAGPAKSRAALGPIFDTYKPA